MGMTDTAEKKSYAAYRAKSLRMLRAAHVGSPAPPGHFLREFGQSDRDTIENANYDASVPQALSLLNGSTFGMVSSSQSVLSRNVNAARTPEEKIDTIFPQPADPPGYRQGENRSSCRTRRSAAAAFMPIPPMP